MQRQQFLLVLLLPFGPLWAAKILIVFPYDAASQCNLLTPYVEALWQHGHQLTVIHALSDCAMLERLNSTIYIQDRYNSTSDFTPYESSGRHRKWVEILSIRSFTVKMSLNVLENEEVQKLMRSNTRYDALVMEPLETFALFGLAAHFNASLIGLATSGAHWNLDTMVGYTATFEPILPIGFRFGALTLLDRIYNWVFISEEWLLIQLILLPRFRSLHEHFFGHLSQSFAEVGRSFSLILLNQHFSVFEARPNAPNMVEVGGMHVPKQLLPLPQELATFIDEASQGVIYMSLGFDLQSKDLPKETLSLILETFESLPQRIIWKYEDDTPPFNVSSKTYIDKWLPQQAILAHPNVRLLITHGGMLSTIEAAHYGKPVLGMPVFFDQFRNVERLRALGVAQILNINTLNKQELEATVRQLMEQPQYSLKAKALSIRFRDQLTHPLDTAVYWTEYVLRYGGAPHMRVSTSNIKLIDYYGLDNILMVFGRLALISFFIFYVFSKLKRWLS